MQQVAGADHCQGGDVAAQHAGQLHRQAAPRRRQGEPAQHTMVWRLPGRAAGARTASLLLAAGCCTTYSVMPRPPLMQRICAMQVYCLTSRGRSPQDTRWQFDDDKV